MATFFAKIECADGGRAASRRLKFDLGEYATGIEIARLAERNAERLGWKRFTVTILNARAIAPERIGSPQH